MAPPASNLGDLLDWQRAAILEQRFRQHDPDKNLQALRQDMGVEGFYERQPTPTGNPLVDRTQGVLNHIGRGTIDAGIRFATDPLTYESFGVGPLARMALSPLRPVGGALAGLAARAVPPVAREALNEGRTVANALGQTYAKWMRPGGVASVTAGRHATAEALGLEARTAAHAAELARRFDSLYGNAVRGLDDTQKAQAYQILHGELALRGAPPKVADAVGLLDRLRKSAIYMKAQPGSGLRTRIAYAARASAPAAPQARRTVVPIHAVPDYVANRLGIDKPTGAESLPQMEDPLRDLSAQDKALMQSFRAGDIPHSAVPAHVHAAYAQSESVFNDWMTVLRNAAKNAGFAKSATAPSTGALLQDLGTPILEKPEYERGAFGVLRPTARERGTYTMRGHVAPPAFNLPPELRQWSDIPGEYTPANYRRNYVPGPREAKAVDPNRVVDARNALDQTAFDPHKLTQEDFTVHPSDPQQYEDAFRGMLKSTAHVVTSNDLLVAMKREFPRGVPADIHALFDKPETRMGTSRTSSDVLGGAWRKIISMPRIGIIGTSPRHMFNVLNLFANSAPEQFPTALARFVKLQTLGDPGARFEYLRPAVDMGIEAPFTERKTYLERMPLIGKAAGAMNKATWDWDTAATWTLADDLLAKGEAKTPREAGQLARDYMVNYHRPTLLAQKLQNALPFATFEAQIPRAVLKGVLRNPARATALNQATGGFLYGRSDGTNYDSSTKYYGPTAKVGRLFDLGDVGTRKGYRGLGDYMRGAIGDPIRMALDEALGGPTNHYFNYGHQVTGKTLLGAATSPLAYSRDILNQFNLGEFPKSPPAAQILSTTTGMHVPVGAPNAQDAARQKAVQGAFRHPISLLKKAGDDQGAQILDDLMQATLAGDRDKVRTLQAQFQQHRLERVRAMLSNGAP